MMSLIDDLKQTAREMPWLVMAVALLVVIGIGFNAEVVNSADGDEARLCFGRVDGPPMQELNAGEQIVRRCALDIRPGITVLIGVEHYQVMLSIPEASVRSRLAHVQMDSASVQPVLDRIFGTAVPECRG
jgi:hypothetical protein